MLYHCRNEVVNLSCGTKENLALAIGSVLLNVEGDGLCDAEILGSFRHSDSHIFGELEEMVDGMARGEDNSCIIRYVHLLLTKLLCGDSFYLYERTEYQLYVKLLGYLVVWRISACWFGL